MEDTQLTFGAWVNLLPFVALPNLLSDLESLRTETVYGLTSLTASEASADQLLALTRQYWGIENGLHYRRDVTHHEDATRMSNTRAAQIWSSINNLLVGTLARLGFDYLPQARRCFDAKPALAVDTLTHRTLKTFE